MRALIFILSNMFLICQFELDLTNDTLNAIAVTTLLFFAMDISELCSKFVAKAGDGK